MAARLFSLVVFLALGLTLEGCRLEATDRIEVHPDGSAQVHFIANMDDELYNIAKSSPSAQGQGWRSRVPTSSEWHITESGGAGSHVYDAVRTYDPETSAQWFLFTSDPAPAPRLTTSSSFFTKRYEFNADVPVLAPNQPGSSGASPTIGQQLQSMLGSSNLTFRVQISIPGAVVATNGTPQSDGSSSWDLSMQRPTHIQVASQRTNWVNIIVLIIVFVAADAVTIAYILKVRAARG